LHLDRRDLATFSETEFAKSRIISNSPNLARIGHRQGGFLMTLSSKTRWVLTCAIVSLISLGSGLTAKAEQPGSNLRKPVHRVANRPETNADAVKPATTHPLDPAIRLAKHGLTHIQANIRDYTTTMVKRERVDGELTGVEFIYMKIRNRKLDQNGKVVVPFSVYTKHLKPASKKGQEAIWIEGHRDNKIVAHGSGPIRGKIKVKIDPDGRLAMEDNRYPIYSAGMENLCQMLMDKGIEERKYPECEVKFYKDAKINGRKCLLIEMRHPVQRPHFEWTLARVYVDEELQIPIRFVSWGFPQTPGGKPQLLEEYTYTSLKLNVGLTDADFDSDNPNYAYPY
jgi:hypothetical protein